MVHDGCERGGGAELLMPLSILDALHLPASFFSASSFASPIIEFIAPARLIIANDDNICCARPSLTIDALQSWGS